MKKRIVLGIVGVSAVAAFMVGCASKEVVKDRPMIPPPALQPGAAPAPAPVIIQPAPAPVVKPAPVAPVVVPK